MTTSVSFKTTTAIRASEELVSALDETFATSFHHWSNESGEWLRVGADGFTLDTEFQADWMELIALADANQTPSVSSRACGECLLAIPLGAPGMVATGRFSETPPDLLLRQANLFLEVNALRCENAKLEDINTSLAGHMTHNYEELAFLRKIASLLALGDQTDPQDLIRAILPHLLLTLQAESLVMVTPKIIRSNLLGSGVLWAGTEILEEDRVRKLCSVFEHHLKKDTVIRNRLQSIEIGRDFPRVRGFMAVNIGENGSWGQLLAFNHVTTNSPPSTWRSSETQFGTVESTLLKSAASLLATHLHNVDLLQQKADLFTEVVRALVNAIEAKDSYTCGHSERVAQFASRLGRQVGLGNDVCNRLHLSGLLHDVGKIAVSDAALEKHGGLSDEEYEDIARHPSEGWAILSDLEHLRHVLPGVLHHHERYDGTGYPDGLAGDEIPLEARIMAICDAYDAMTSDRPYRPKMTDDKVESILRANAGTQWDPELVTAFFVALPDIITIRRDYCPRQPKRRRPAK